jgi:hypothetical protein
MMIKTKSELVNHSNFLDHLKTPQCLCFLAISPSVGVVVTIFGSEYKLWCLAGERKHGPLGLHGIESRVGEHYRMINW